MIRTREATASRQTARMVLLAASALLAIGALATSAHADDRGHDARGHDDHRGGPPHEVRRGRPDDRGGYYGPPPVVYDGGGYYPPPPVVYSPGIGIGLPGININIR